MITAMYKQLIFLSCCLCFFDQGDSALIKVCPVETDCHIQKFDYSYLKCYLEKNNCPSGLICCKSCHNDYPVCLPPIELETMCPQKPKCEYSITDYILQCMSSAECAPGLVCCEDPCFDHKICSRPRQFQKESENCKKMKQSCKTFTPFPYLKTRHLECTTDNECDYNSICCFDNCYEHRICKEFYPPKNILPVKESESCKLLEDTCKNETVFPKETTEHLECWSDEDCGAGKICCSDKCFKHRICKEAPNKLDVLNDKKCPISISNKNFCLHPKLVVRYACKSHADCSFGDICCEDKCYDHKLCKKPSDNYSFIAKPHKKPPGSVSHCPVIDNKCTKPYSLRVAYSFKCEIEEDCPIGYSCCHDVCISYFKVCINNTIQIDEGDLHIHHHQKHVKVQVDQKNTSKIYYYNISQTDEDSAEFIIQPLTLKPEEATTTKSTELVLGSGSGDIFEAPSDLGNNKNKCLNREGFEDAEDCLESSGSDNHEDTFSGSGGGHKKETRCKISQGFEDDEDCNSSGSGDNEDTFSGSGGGHPKETCKNSPGFEDDEDCFILGSGDNVDTISGSGSDHPNDSRCKNSPGFEDDEDCNSSGSGDNEDSLSGSGGGHTKETCKNSPEFEDDEDCYILGSGDNMDMFSGSGSDHSNESRCKNSPGFEDDEDCNSSGSGNSKDSFSGSGGDHTKETRCKNSPEYEDDEDCYSLGSGDSEDTFSGSGSDQITQTHCKNSPGFEDDEDCNRSGSGNNEETFSGSGNGQSNKPGTNLSLLVQNIGIYLSGVPDISDNKEQTSSKQVLKNDENYEYLDYV